MLVLDRSSVVAMVLDGVVAWCCLLFFVLVRVINFILMSMSLVCLLWDVLCSCVVLLYSSCVK